MMLNNERLAALIAGIILLQAASFGKSLAVNCSPNDPGDSVKADRIVRIAVTARPDRDSIVLRWAPTTAGAWLLGNSFGYSVRRSAIGKDSTVGAWRDLTAQAKRPWGIGQFEQGMIDAHPSLAVAAEMLYGKNFKSGPSSAQQASGSMIEGADELENRHGFALFSAETDPISAEALGLRLVDKDITAGSTYIYEVSVAGTDSTYPVEKGVTVVTAIPADLAPPPSNLTAKGLEDRVILSWNEGEYSGYRIYRSEDGGKNFSELTRVPIVPMHQREESKSVTYTDTNVVQYRHYVYRVRGTDEFAGLSLPAEIVSFSRDATPPPVPLLKNPQQVGPHSLKIGWEMPEPAPDLAGFVIARSRYSESGFHDITLKMLPKEAREFVDKDASEDEPFYMIGSVDTAGNVAPTLPVGSYLVDAAPPAVPAGLSGSIDTNGVVSLHWHAGKEKSLLGYRVLFANDLHHEFSQLTNHVLTDTLFRDTISLSSLTKSVYYRIASVSNRYAQSEPTSAIALRRPDVVPPQAPVFTGIQTTDSSVVLTWVPSQSEDCAGHNLYRRGVGEKKWVLLSSLSRKESTYADHAVEPGINYEYEIEAIDSSGLRAMAAVSVQARPYDSGVRPGIDRISASYDKKENRILLHWAYVPAKQEKLTFLIYRSFGKYDLVQYRSVAASARDFSDSGLVGNGVYEYAIKVVTANGAESPLSPRTPVNVSR